MTTETLTITDNRTGKSYEIPIENSTIRALDLRQIKVDPEEFGTMSYDPGYDNTAACKSAIAHKPSCPFFNKASNPFRLE